MVAGDVAVKSPRRACGQSINDLAGASQPAPTMAGFGMELTAEQMAILKQALAEEFAKLAQAASAEPAKPECAPGLNKDGTSDLRFGTRQPGLKRRVTHRRRIQLFRARAARKPRGTHYQRNVKPGTLRMRRYREKLNKGLPQPGEAARMAYKVLLAAARAARGLPPGRTQAERQAAYRKRLKVNQAGLKEISNG